MNVTIQEAAISMSAKYNITTPTETMHAQKKVFSLFANIAITSATQQPLGSVKGKSFFLPKFDITVGEGRVYSYTREQILKGIFKIEGNGEIYHLYTHKGMNHSIFKGETQIAAITKSRLAIGSGATYQVRMDPSADVVLVSGIVLALNTSGGEDKKKGVLNVSVGHIGPEEFPFPNWRPADEA